MGLAAFVDDADVAVVDAADAGVASAAAFVEEVVVRFGPGKAFVETDLQRVMVAALPSLGLACYDNKTLNRSSG